MLSMTFAATRRERPKARGLGATQGDDRGAHWTTGRHDRDGAIGKDRACPTNLQARRGDSSEVDAIMRATL